MGLIKRHYVKVEDRNYLPKKSDISTLPFLAGFEDSDGAKHLRIVDVRNNSWTCVNCHKWGKLVKETQNEK